MDSLPPSLYPAIEPYETGMLRVDDRHVLYWEQSGNPHGVPIVFLHGGPGVGASPTQRRFFDPSHYRIILFDQRGAGRSTPLGETRQNTTALLVQDMEALRAHLRVERWHVFGGSWGSALALAYAQAHPMVCMGLILRGIFLMQPDELDWFFNGVRHIYPDAWRLFRDFLLPEERENMLEAYAARLNSADPAIHMPAAHAWSRFEEACSSLLPAAENTQTACPEYEARLLSFARIQVHYIQHNRFTPPDRLLRDVGKIRHIPAAIIQGRYDCVCPIVTADALHREWPEADYIIVPDAGHSTKDPSLCAALVQATDRFRQIV